MGRHKKRGPKKGFEERRGYKWVKLRYWTKTRCKREAMRFLYLTSLLALRYFASLNDLPSEVTNSCLMPRSTPHAVSRTTGRSGSSNGTESYITPSLKNSSGSPHMHVENISTALG